MTDEHGSQWHISKTISLGHIVTTAVVVVTGVLYLASLETRIESTTLEVAHQKDAIARVEQRQERDQNELTRKLGEIRTEQKADSARIERKLDKLIERELDK